MTLKPNTVDTHVCSTRRQTAGAQSAQRELRSNRNNVNNIKDTVLSYLS